MKTIEKMKEYFNYFYHQIQKGLEDKEQLQHKLTELENAFYELSEQEQYDVNQKDKRMLAFESYAQEKLEFLQEKVKTQTSNVHIQEQTIQLAKTIKAFCAEASFPYLKEFSVDQRGTIELELGFSLSYHTMTSDTPVSTKNQVEATKKRLKDEGFVLNERGTEFMDCDSNKEKLKEMILKRFPSARIFSWESKLEYHQTNEHRLHSVRLRLFKIEEIIKVKTPH